MHVMSPNAMPHKPDQLGSATGAWWAVYTRHQHEKTVAGMLENKGFEVFLPLYESERRWKDRAKTLSLPVFPNYVFVRGELSRRLQIVSTPGAHLIVSNGTQFSEIPDKEIAAIRRAVNAPNRVLPHPVINAGDRVRVIRGTLEGLEGVLLRNRNSYRLILNVAMLAQSAAVEVDAIDVELLNPQPNIGLAGQLVPEHKPRTKWETQRSLREQAIAAVV